MEQVVYLLQPVNVRKKQMVVSLAIRKGLKEHSHAVFKTIAKGLVPLSYFKVIIQLLRHADKNVRKKVKGGYVFSKSSKGYVICNYSRNFNVCCIMPTLSSSFM